jgi:putative transcriptional regulator
MKRWAALLLCALLSINAGAQHSTSGGSVLLVAKPGLPDPRFSETVVLVTRTPDLQVVGVILNRPLPTKLSQLVIEPALARNYSGPVFFGGPVMSRMLVALFHSATEPRSPAFRVSSGVYLSMHPGNVERLLKGEGDGYPAGYRIYAGFSAWAPDQLENEIESDSWYVLPVSDAVLFRSEIDGMWEELLEKARGKRAALY